MDLVASGRWSANPKPSKTMLHWSLVFLVVALIAGVLGLTGIAGMSAQIAWILFVIFLILWLVSFVMRGARKL